MVSMIRESQAPQRIEFLLHDSLTDRSIQMNFLSDFDIDDMFRIGRSLHRDIPMSLVSCALKMALTYIAA